MRKFVKLKGILSMYGLVIVTCIRVIFLRTCLSTNLSVSNSVTVKFMTITLDVKRQLRIIYD